MMIVPAETGRTLFRDAAFGDLELRVSDPALTSYLTIRNHSGETLLLTLTPIRGLVLCGRGPCPEREHIRPGAAAVLEFSVSYGAEAAQNFWSLDFTVGSAEPASAIGSFWAHIPRLYNAPGRNPSPGDPGRNETWIEYACSLVRP